MAKYQSTFIKGRMNKDSDERLLPDGEYVDAQNARTGGTEDTESGALENTKGNVQLTTLKYKTVELSSGAVCIGALDDAANETMYWCVHDPIHPTTGGVVDMIVSFNTTSQQLTYHVITTSLLNFSPSHLMTAFNIIDDLLFFSDNYNQPRKINVTRGYAEPNAFHVDQISEIDISVIKPQPKESPTFVLSQSSGQENYIKDAFICFSYRYKYRDGEYSALTQFSKPAFQPNVFNLDISSHLNDGMQNVNNSAKVSFNTGPENVIGIDVVYKEADSNIIYVIDKLDKEILGYQDDSVVSIDFRNGDVYTILSQGELLRLYDNVPLLAKAQTVSGNRLMYGNYVEGRDLINANGEKVNLNYTIELVSVDSTFTQLNVEIPFISYDYYFDATPPGFVTVPEGRVNLDTSTINPLELKAGAIISFEVTVESSAIGGSDYTLTNGLVAGGSFTIQFLHTLEEDFNTVFDAMNSQAWKSQVGLLNNYQADPSQWNQGVTLTDVYNTATPTPSAVGSQPAIEPYRSGRGDIGDTCYDPNTTSLYLAADPFDNLVFICSAIQYQEVVNPTKNQYYQYFNVVRAEATFFPQGDSSSLHSNRDYQVGIVYQDGEGRQTTTLTSTQDSIHIPAKNSDSKNSVKVTIPAAMLPPLWADRYKFVMKSSQGGYDTIFASVFYIGDNSSDVWIKLEGEQQNKLTIGQELIVKADSNGALDTVAKVTILDIVSQEQDFIAGNVNQDGDIITEPAGLYVRVNPKGWSATYADNAILTSGPLSSSSSSQNATYPPPLNYPLHTPIYDYAQPIPGGYVIIGYEPWEIPAGSIVNIDIKFKRDGRSGTLECADQKCTLTKQITAQQDYSNFQDFWDGEYVNLALIECENIDPQEGPIGPEAECNIYNPTLYDLSSGATDWIVDPSAYPIVGGVNAFVDCYSGFQLNGNPTPRSYNYQFRTYSSGTNAGQFFLGLSKSGTGLGTCGAFKKSRSTIECEISVRKVTTLLVFETIPAKTTDEIYFENEQSFPITGGFHMSGDVSGDQNQTGSQDAIVNLSFFDCFQFSNGVESYKVRDSITGKKFFLGNRVTSVSEQDYKQTRRKASITYSGVFQSQNNVNRLNEFNLGLANYKDCEESYGPIQVLHGRKTDVLTLQEDKVSYIVLGKNLLTAADGAGILTSVPEVLGTQIARIEEYGISENPESFANYGADIYFTDAKRASVIQLKGGTSSESLSAISSKGMRTWFRDLFQSSFNYQKLGGYDPYMDEYVLSPKDTRLPAAQVRYDCGGAARFFTGILSPYTYVIDAGASYGDMTIEYTTSNDEFTVSATFNGTTVSNPTTTAGTHSFIVDKNVPTISDITITITPDVPSGDSTISIETPCPVSDRIVIVPVSITSRADGGKTITNIYNYEDSTVSPTYYAPPQGGAVTFLYQNSLYISDNIVSQFGPNYSGPQGTGSIPIDNSNVRMLSFKNQNDTYVFNSSTDKMTYLRTATAYTNTEASIASLISAASGNAATITGSAPLYIGNFAMPTGIDGDYLYLIWDYRESNAIKLCYSTDVDEACCECTSSPNCVPFYGSAVSTVDSATACADNTLTVVYHTDTATNFLPIVGSRIYSSLGCADTAIQFPAGWIHYDDNGTDKWIEIDSNNTVINSGNC